jgi:hypothetical protein
MKMKEIRILAHAILAIFFGILLSLSTRADGLTLSLSTVVSGSPGANITVDGTITNDGADTVYLNSEDFTLGSSSFLNGDVTDFFLNAPLSLNPGTGSGLIALFTFDTAAGTSRGTYSGNFLDIIGGADPSDFTDVLASAEFPVSVTATPEPGTPLLLFSGLLMLAVSSCLRRQVYRRCRAT